MSWHIVSASGFARETLLSSARKGLGKQGRTSGVDQTYEDSETEDGNPF